jgi:hypothetical protein
MSLDKSWHDYNESLIKRGRILMDIGFIKSWNKEISNMNEGKVGARFEYCHSYIHFLAFLKIGFKIPCCSMPPSILYHLRPHRLNKQEEMIILNGSTHLLQRMPVLLEKGLIE